MARQAAARADLDIVRRVVRMVRGRRGRDRDGRRRRLHEDGYGLRSGYSEGLRRRDGDVGSAGARRLANDFTGAGDAVDRVVRATPAGRVRAVHDAVGDDDVFLLPHLDETHCSCGGRVPQCGCDRVVIRGGTRGGVLSRMGRKAGEQSLRTRRCAQQKETFAGSQEGGARQTAAGRKAPPSSSKRRAGESPSHNLSCSPGLRLGTRVRARVTPWLRPLMACPPPCLCSPPHMLA